jgi:7-keto-8-aminopelargonate synthetase-like enzyme
MEKQLAAFKGTEAVVTFSAGFMALSATVGTIAGDGDFIFSDEMNHASIINGARSSKAKIKVYRHLDTEDLAAKLKEVPEDAGKLIVTDGVFSMEGDICDLPGLGALAAEHGAKLMVDDAHSTGVLGRTGRGTAEHFDMEGKVDIVSGTLSKSFGAVGGYTGSTATVVEYLRYRARQSIFSASLPPSVAASVTAALKVLVENPGLLENLRRNTEFMTGKLKEAGFTVHDHGTPILPIVVNDDNKTYRATGRLQEEGVFANPVVFPAVPMGKSLIRISLMATHTEEQLNIAADRFKKVGAELGII